VSDNTNAAKNLEAIQKAVVQHNGNCPGEILEIQLSPFEHERLGWDDFRGIPIVPEPKVGTGRMRLVCSLDHDNEKVAEEEAEGSAERELVTVGGDQERRTL
jgi:hypothetical protein